MRFTGSGGVGTHPGVVGQTADASNSSDSYCATGSPIQWPTASGLLPSRCRSHGPAERRNYEFGYDGTTGLLKQITYPDGGWVKYTWGWSTRADHIYSYDTQGNRERADGLTMSPP